MLFSKTIFSLLFVIFHSVNRFNFCSFYVCIYMKSSSSQKSSSEVSGVYLFVFGILLHTVPGKKMVCIPLIQWDLLS